MDVEGAIQTLHTPRLLDSGRLSKGEQSPDGGLAVVPMLSKAESKVLEEEEDAEREEAIIKLELAAEKLAREAERATRQLTLERESRRASALCGSTNGSLGSFSKEADAPPMPRSRSKTPGSDSQPVI